MEKFIVSARKYRPITFNDVVGQSTITNILKSAIRNNHLAHAFLFCGPRGVGKTTCARILAKTINCMNLKDDMEPCNECDSCISFNSSASFNVHELDAASNNSVEDIRSLIEQVRIPPQIGIYSIYIIDEVHMLSQAAFNAFLKTLEEPPKHAIFILATTEKHKIIPTILSRCQIFNFKRIQNKDIVTYLKYVSGKEKIEVEEEALHVIAQKSDGAMRDSLSIFDQVASSITGKLTYKDVITSLNVLDTDYFFKAVEAILISNISDLLLLFNNVLDNGFEGQHFLGGLSQHFRDLLVCKDAQTLNLLEVGDTIKLKYQQQSTKIEDRIILRALDLLNQCDIGYRTSQNQRLHVEVVLMKLCALTLAGSSTPRQS